MKDNQPCREAFEAEMRKAPNFTELPWLVRDGEGYIYEVTESRWWGFRAAYYLRPVQSDLDLLGHKATVAKALGALFLEVHESVAQDVTRKVNECIAAFESRTPPISYDAAVQKVARAIEKRMLQQAESWRCSCCGWRYYKKTDVRVSVNECPKCESVKRKSV